MNNPFLRVALLALSVTPFALLPATAQAADPAPKAAPAKPAAKSAAKPTAAGEQADIPADVREEMSKLVTQAAQLASGPLQAGDEFQPYGVLLLNDDTLKSVNWQKPNPPPALEVFRQIYFAMQREAQKNPAVKAAVTIAPTATMATVSDQSKKTVQVQMLRAEVDHRRGSPLIVLLPYTRENGKIVFGETKYLPGQNAIFLRGQPAAPAAAKPAKP
ncbi:MAG: hypothetical protein ACOY33_02070 [Pseudomonadota bacterium]